MNIHEFGKENKETVILIHPSIVRWDYFEYVIPYLESRYHLVVPALPGYDSEEDSDFSSVEQIAGEIACWVREKGLDDIHAVYGCSMGGSIALLFTLAQATPVRHCVMDGGITPYQLPRFLTRFIALKDYLMMMTGKAGGIKLLEKAFATDEYSKEDLEYASDVLRHCSSRTLWRTFDSCNNHSVPVPVPDNGTCIHYWYAEGEEKERRLDIRYMKEHFPDTEFRVLPSIGHAGLAVKKPELFASLIKGL